MRDSAAGQKQGNTPIGLPFVGVLFLGLLALTLSLGAAPRAEAQAGLAVADCAKCHDREPGEIEARGAAHKTAINCLDCHENHRPKVAKNIPQCSSCHEGTAHFRVEGCRTCHNPHAPLEIALKGELKSVCLTCHEEPGRQMTANPSAHAKVACNYCHAERHKAIPACGECHEPHSPTMSQADCRVCHQVHMPTLLNYGPQTASTLCASCHQEAYTLVTGTKTKHRTVPCASCHPGTHKAISPCTACHGTPHAAGMHQRFPKCGDCHSTAHDLNNWGGGKGPAGEKK
jgi:predicted CXXCH cytochrome family protein